MRRHIVAQPGSIASFVESRLHLPAAPVNQFDLFAVRGAEHAPFERQVPHELDRTFGQLHPPGGAARFPGSNLDGRDPELTGASVPIHDIGGKALAGSASRAEQEGNFGEGISFRVGVTWQGQRRRRLEQGLGFLGGEPAYPLVVGRWPAPGSLGP